MKKKILSLSTIGLVCIAFMLYGQSTPTTVSLLSECVWVIKDYDDYDEVMNPPVMKFTDNEFSHAQIIDGRLFQNKKLYYLSDVIPTVFDSTKIGNVPNGKYIVTMDYDNHLNVYEILELTADKLELKFFGEGRYTGEGLSSWIATPRN